MPVYRLFPIATTGLIADKPIIIDAIHDEAALTQSERMRDDRTREVWRGDRLVGVVLGRPARDQLASTRAAFGSSPCQKRRSVQNGRA